MMSIERMLSIACEAVDIGHELMSTTQVGHVQEKDDRDFVTALDIEIQRKIRDFLSRVTPEADFVGEEEGGGTVDAGRDSVWVLDPVDGTSNFAHGMPLCTTSLALVQRGEPVLGVVAVPLLGFRYYAARGMGAYRNDELISTSGTEDLSRAIISVGDYATGTGSTRKNSRRLAVTRTLAENVERVRMFGAASIDLVWAADGRTEGCVLLSNKPWDMAAGVVIAREAGASVTDLSGMAYTFDSREVVALNRSVAPALVELLGPRAQSQVPPSERPA